MVLRGLCRAGGRQATTQTLLMPSRFRQPTTQVLPFVLIEARVCWREEEIKTRVSSLVGTRTYTATPPAEVPTSPRTGVAGGGVCVAVTAPWLSRAAPAPSRPAAAPRCRGIKILAAASESRAGRWRPLKQPAGLQPSLQRYQDGTRSFH
jgi:hypothetical protein